MTQHATKVNDIFQVEKALPANASRANIALRTEIAKRLLCEASEDEQEQILRSVAEDYQSKCDVKAHLEEADSSDPLVQAK